MARRGATIPDKLQSPLFLFGLLESRPPQRSIRTGSTDAESDRPTEVEGTHFLIVRVGTGNPPGDPDCIEAEVVGFHLGQAVSTCEHGKVPSTVALLTIVAPFVTFVASSRS